MAAAPATIDRLAKYCQATAGDPYVAECAEEAADMVAEALVGAPRTPPASVVARAVLEVGKELFDRRQSRNGIAGFGETDFAPMRIARDPMKAAQPYLERYTGPALA